MRVLMMLMVTSLAVAATAQIEMPPLVPDRIEDFEVEAPTPKSVDVSLAKAQWERLLAYARRRGREDDRLEVVALRAEAAAPWVDELAKAVLEEWKYTSNHTLLIRPRKVWAPELPPLVSQQEARRGRVRIVQGRSSVNPLGEVIRAEIIDSSGDDEIDFLIQKWARESRYRPALEDRKWRESRDSWAVEVK